jgi:RimJ/RimL family protein N-acetyltransferase
MSDKKDGPGPTTLTGAGFSLIPFREEHISPAYLGWLNDPEVNRYLEVRHVRQTRETAAAFVRSFDGDVEKYMWGIYPEGRKEPVGTATLYHVDRRHGSVELGLLIGDKSYWGKHTASAVIGLVAGFAFGPLGLRRMTGGTYAPHHGMNFIYKLLGFRQEGKMIKALELTPGVYVDGYRWGILAEEWRARHGA